MSEEVEGRSGGQGRCGVVRCGGPGAAGKQLTGNVARPWTRTLSREGRALVELRFFVIEYEDHPLRRLHHIFITHLEVHSPPSNSASSHFQLLSPLSCPTDVPPVPAAHLETCPTSLYRLHHPPTVSSYSHPNSSHTPLIVHEVYRSNSGAQQASSPPSAHRAHRAIVAFSIAHPLSCAALSV